MTKREYIKSLEKELKELDAEKEILIKFKDFLEEQLTIYEEEIKQKEGRIDEINIEINDLEDYVWGNNQESENTYMHDVLPPYEF